MIQQLAKWAGKVNVNGTEYASIADVPENLELNGTTVITLIPRQAVQKVAVVNGTMEHVITVKAYMTKPASPEFDFMAKWNNNVPMPMRTMVGTVVKETKGMVYMKLHGALLAERTYTCMCCGRQLTNPVSQYFGVGPECGGHNYTHPFDTDEELREAVEAYKKVLLNKTWTGWIIKSAILEDTEMEVAV